MPPFFMLMLMLMMPFISYAMMLMLTPSHVDIYMRASALMPRAGDDATPDVAAAARC